MSPEPTGTAIGRGTTITSPGVIILPKSVWTPNWTVELVDKDGTTDFSEDVLRYSYNYTDRDRIGEATITLDNRSGRLTNKFNPGETIRISLDYANGDTLRFKGKIFSKKFSVNPSTGYILNIKCRQVPELLGLKRSFVFENENIDDAIKSVVTDLNTFYPSTILTTTNVASTTKTVTTSYIETRVWDILVDLIKRGGLSSYIDTADDLHTFDEGSIDNDDESIALGDNILSVNSWGVNVDDISNIVRIYGRSFGDNLTPLWESENSQTKNKFWINDLVINSGSLETVAEVKEKSEAEINNLGNEVTKGNITTIGIFAINPGEMMRVDIPPIDVKGKHKIKSFTQSFSGGGVRTTFDMNERQFFDTRVIKNITRNIEDLRNINNPNAMRYSFLMTFNESTNAANFIDNIPGALSVSDGFLRHDRAVIDTATLTSVTFDLPRAIKETELIVEGEEIVDSTYEVSFDNGATYTDIKPGTDNKINITAIGLKGRLRITSRSTNSNPDPKWNIVEVRCK